MNGPQMPGGASDPISERRAIKVYVLPLVDLRPAIQRQMIGVLGDQNLSDGCFGRNAAFDQPGGSRSLDDNILAGPAGILRAANNQHPELGRNDVELLADVFADPM
jgi:hypothetical protein